MGELHPEVRKVLIALEQELSDLGLSDLHSAGVEKARSFGDGLVLPEEDLPRIASVENRTIPGPGDQLRVRVFRPREGFLPALMWFHGGGWVLGSLDLAEMNCRRLAIDADCVVVSVDYRLAPETPFPGAIRDCLAATTWVHDNAVDLGIDPGRIAVGGDSAGGNLAACVAYAARDYKLPLVFQLLVYPVIDADFDRTSYLDCSEGLLLTRSAMIWFWDQYVPDPADRSNPHVAPIQASNLSGLPPALIMTAEFDPLRDEGEAYGEALNEAGSIVETIRYEGVIHGFFNMLTEEPVDEIIAASQDAVAALRRAFQR